MRICLTAFTKQGGRLCLKLQHELTCLGYAVESYSKYLTAGVNPWGDSLKGITQKAFESCEAIIYIGAAGIAVRAIAPFLKAKDIDPAVLVIDEKGKYVIPILSGHIGGANRLAEKIAKVLEAQAVIATATDINDKFSVDSWAVENSCSIANVEIIKDISAAILNEEQIGLYSEFPVEEPLPGWISRSHNTRVGICISGEYKPSFQKTLHLIPRQYVIGIGCRRNTGYDILLGVVNNALERAVISEYQIEAIASIDLKAEEAALLRLSKQWRIPFYTYSAQELSLLDGDFTSSDFVRDVTGVDNVCERAALKVAMKAGNGQLILTKYCSDGVTVAIAKKEWSCRF